MVPWNQNSQITIYSIDYNNNDCFCHIQGLLHEELSGLFPETTISIKYTPGGDMRSYVVVLKHS
jgi:hypothetical protein